MLCNYASIICKALYFYVQPIMWRGEPILELWLQGELNSRLPVREIECLTRTVVFNGIPFSWCKPICWLKIACWYWFYWKRMYKHETENCICLTICQSVKLMSFSSHFQSKMGMEDWKSLVLKFPIKVLKGANEEHGLNQRKSNF